MAIRCLPHCSRLFSNPLRALDNTDGGRLCKSMAFLFFVGGLAFISILLIADTLGSSSATTFNILLNGKPTRVSGTFKKAYTNDDGSVDVVFNIPISAKGLLHVNATDTGIDREAIDLPRGERSLNTTGATNTPNDTVRMPYPVTLETNYVINSRRICPPDEDLDFLITVHSATAYFDRREVMRRTFAAKRLFGKIRHAIVFLLGRTDDPVTSSRIKHEAILYGDIVQGDFFDSYHNLTHKGVMGYRWITEFCPRAKLILKLDDDVFVNPFMLIQEVFPKFKNKTRQMACHLRPKFTSPIFRGQGKWQVRVNEFKGYYYYPFNYCNGYFVLLTTELVKPMLNAVRLNPFFWIDDVYLFGMLPATVGNVSFVDLSKNLATSFDKGKYCYTQQGLGCKLFGVAQWRKTESTFLWHTLLKITPKSTKKEFGLFNVF